MKKANKTQDNKHKTVEPELLNHCACPDCTLQESLKSRKKPGLIELVWPKHGYPDCHERDREQVRPKPQYYDSAFQKSLSTLPAFAAKVPTETPSSPFAKKGGINLEKSITPRIALSADDILWLVQSELPPKKKIITWTKKKPEALEAQSSKNIF